MCCSTQPPLFPQIVSISPPCEPDFVSVSFYKMFGYPTGVGALLIRRAALAKLKRPWFAGGTINFASVQGQAHVLSPNEAAFEDGTLNYLSIPAVEIGLRHLESIGLDLIARARPMPDRMAARGVSRPAAQQWPRDGPHLWPGDNRKARRHGDFQPLRSAGALARL